MRESLEKEALGPVKNSLSGGGEGEGGGGEGEGGGGEGGGECTTRGFFAGAGPGSGLEGPFCISDLETGSIVTERYTQLANYINAEATRSYLPK